MIHAGHTKFYYSGREKDWYPVCLEEVHVSRLTLMRSWCEMQPSRSLYYPDFSTWDEDRLHVSGHYWFEKKEDAILFALTWL